MITDKTYHVYFDGAFSKGGVIGWGFIINKWSDSKQKYMKHYSDCGTVTIEEGTVQVAEFYALAQAMQTCLDLDIESSILFIGDNKQIITQMRFPDSTIVMRARSMGMKSYYKWLLICKSLSKQYIGVSFKWLPREHNKFADELSKEFRKLK